MKPSDPIQTPSEIAHTNPRSFLNRARVIARREIHRSLMRKSA